MTEAVSNLSIVRGATGGAEEHRKNIIQVSNSKKPLFFYVNLTKRYMHLHNEVEHSTLGMAIATMVTVAEILKIMALLAGAEAGDKEDWRHRHTGAKEIKENITRFKKALGARQAVARRLTPRRRLGGAQTTGVAMVQISPEQK